ncbi:MAG: hypothetical protein WCF36_06910 [Candidatus Nanopelagicales bacterium]
MIDIFRDYTAIGMGSAQATTSRIVQTGRAGVDQVHALVSEQWADPPGAAVVRQVVRSHEALGARVHTEVEDEIRALREQVARLERMIAGLRGDR